MTKDWISNLLFVPKEHIYNSCKEEIYISRYIHILYIHTQKLKEKSEKAGLKLNIQKTKIMASSPITSWQIEGGKVERVADFIFLGCKITADDTAAMKLKDACSLEEKPW